MSIGSSAIPGGVMNRLVKNNMNPIKALRTNALLSKDEWKDIDTRVYRSAAARLVIYTDLADAGFIHKLPNIGITRSEWIKDSGTTDATIAMSAQAIDNNDLVDLEKDGVPVPTIFKDFQLDIRTIAASRGYDTGSATIDNTNIDAASKRVAEGIESLIFNGYKGKFVSQPIYGLTNHPNVNNNGGVPYTLNTLENIVECVQKMIEALVLKKQYGPYHMYVSPTISSLLDRFFLGTYNQMMTVREQLQKIESLKKISAADMLAANTIVLVQMSADTIDWAAALDITTVEWDENPGGVNYRVWAIGAPRIKADVDGNLGVAAFKVDGTLVS